MGGGWTPASRRALPAGRDPGGGPGLRRETTPDVYIVERIGVVATAGRPTATTTTRTRPRTDCATRSTPSWPAAGSRPPSSPRRVLDQVEVELLCWEGCPSHPAALADLRDGARARRAGHAARDRDAEEQAERRALPGLPHDPGRRRGPLPVRRAALAAAAASTGPTAGRTPSVELSTAGVHNSTLAVQSMEIGPARTRTRSVSPSPGRRGLRRPRSRGSGWRPPRASAAPPGRRRGPAARRTGRRARCRGERRAGQGQRRGGAG